MTLLLRALQKLLRVPAPRVAAEDALRIARAEAARREVKVGRLIVHEGLRKWIVWIDSDSKGSPVVEIDNQNGDIVKWVSLPR